MIGQNKNKELLMQWRMNKSVPRFIIIEGDEGSGRLELAKVIMKMINATGIIAGNGIADVREIIENAYTVTDTTCYIFRNADDMSVAAKNSLLKVVEEPPNKSYFIMTARNIDNMLGTIKSRGTCLFMEPYSKKELNRLCDSSKLLEYATVPGELIDWQESTIIEAEALVDNIIDALMNKSGTRILKETCKLRTKSNETDKIDTDIFLYILSSKIHKINMNSIMIDALAECKRQFSYQSINKKASIECMLIKILEEMKNAEIS